MKSGLYCYGCMGVWVMRAEDIEGLIMVQIAEKFALPQVPKGIVDVQLPAGTPMRASVANDILLGERFGGAGAGVQFEIRLPKANLDDGWFKER